MDEEKYIKKWIEDSLSNEERQYFEKTETFAILKKLSDNLDAFRAPDYHPEEEYNRLKGKISSVPKSVQINWMNPIFRVAAIFLVFAILYVLFLRQPVTKIETISGQKKEFLLPDSSFVHLNASSQLSYNTFKWNKSRSLKLDGEAYFKVTRGSNFDVLTSSGIVSVLGTQFNVKVRSNFFEVVCYEGKVRVITDHDTTELVHNEVFRIQNGISARDQYPDLSAPGWINNESIFRSVPVVFVFDEFERQYDKNIVTENVSMDQLFTGRFVHDNIELALKSITLPLNLTYQFNQNNEIIITSEDQ